MAEQQPDRSKRRFLKAGLVAAPVIVTLSAKPAWARQATTGYVPANKFCSVTPDDPNCVPALDSTLSSNNLF